MPCTPYSFPDPSSPTGCRRDVEHWTKKPPRHGSCPETYYLLQYIYQKYYQVFQGRGKEMCVGCSCLLWKLKCSHKLLYAETCLYLVGVGHGGTLQLAARGLCSKGFISVAESWRQQIPLFQLDCERAEVVTEKCLLWYQAVFWLGVLWYLP